MSGALGRTVWVLGQAKLCKTMIMLAFEFTRDLPQPASAAVAHRETRGNRSRTGALRWGRSQSVHYGKQDEGNGPSPRGVVNRNVDRPICGSSAHAKIRTEDSVGRKEEREGVGE